MQILKFGSNGSEVALLKKGLTRAGFGPLALNGTFDRSTELALRDDTNEKLIRRYRACLMIDGKSERTAYQYVRTATKL